MTVYVDDMRAPFGRMVMCHMIADNDTELVAMAQKIGVAVRWHQHPGTPRSHFDICLSKRAAAVKAGAVEITWHQLGRIVSRRRRWADRDSRNECRDCGLLLAPHRRFWCMKCVLKYLPG